MKVQGFLLTQAGWGGAGQEQGLGRRELGRRCGKRREGCEDGMENRWVGRGLWSRWCRRSDVKSGRWGRDAEGPGTDAGKRGDRGGS